MSAAKEFYAKLYRAEDTLSDADLQTHVDTLLEGFHRTIPPESRALLDAPITQQEIADTISKLPKGKAPGPDGFPHEFYYKYRTQTIPLFTGMTTHISRTGNYPDMLKRANITRIHKKNSKADLSNYRPISLLSCAAKIITGTLTKRLYAIADEVILP